MARATAQSAVFAAQGRGMKEERKSPPVPPDRKPGAPVEEPPDRPAQTPDAPVREPGPEEPERL